MSNADTITYHCASCGKTNRLPVARLRDNPICGACKQRVFPDRPVTVTQQTFEREVTRAPLPVVVDLWAPWCGPCRSIAPVLESMASRHAGRLKVVKVNVDENQQLAQRFGAMSIPTMLVMRQGREVDRVVGALPPAALEQRLLQAV